MYGLKKLNLYKMSKKYCNTWWNIINEIKIDRNSWRKSTVFLFDIRISVYLILIL